MGNSEAKYHGIQLSDHVKLSPRADTVQYRSELERAWRKFYAPWISKCSRERSKFIGLDMLCRGVSLTQIINIKKETWSEEEQRCDGVYVRFELCLDIRFRKRQLRQLRLRTVFDGDFSDFDDNAFDKYTAHWTPSLRLKGMDTKTMWLPFLRALLSGEHAVAVVVLEYVHGDEDDAGEDVCIIDDGKVDKDVCFLIAGLIGIAIEDAVCVEYCFGLLWKWFLSKHLIAFRKETVDEKMLWRQSASECI